MKKLILPIIVLFILLLVSPFNTYAQGAVNLNGTWSWEGNSFTGQTTGSSISITGNNGRGFKGTITGNIVKGKEYLVSDKCPNLNHDSPATGVISADGNSITVTFINNTYSLDECVDNPGTDFEDTHAYTRTNAQNSPTTQPSPSPTPTDTPLNLNGAWTTVNEKGTSFTFSGRHTGNSLNLQITDVSDDIIKDSIGKTSLSGTLSGRAFSGTQILIPYVPKCLGKYFNTDGTGTVAADGSSITISFTNFRYDTDTCAKISGTEFQGSVTYVRVNKGQNPTRGKDVEQVSPTPEITKIAEEPSVGVSSKDFKALARAQAELQKAQAELEEIKKANDPRYEAKKDFVSEYNASFKGQEKLKTDLEILRADLEDIHELTSKYNDFSEIEETIESIKKGEIGDYGKLDLLTDAVKSFNDYYDLRANGVSAKDATTKATLDNFGSSVLTLIPVLKAIDLVATTPDFILESFGVGEGNWSRAYVTDGFIGKFAPSGVVQQTTELMIEDDWADIGNALVYGWGKVQSAEGVVQTAQEAGKLLAATVGAVPVAIAQGVSDVVGGGLAIGEGIVDFVSSWFTYPN